MILIFVGVFSCRILESLRFVVTIWKFKLRNTKRQIGVSLYHYVIVTNASKVHRFSICHQGHRLQGMLRLNLGEEYNRNCLFIRKLQACRVFFFFPLFNHLKLCDCFHIFNCLAVPPHQRNRNNEILLPCFGETKN